jgi:hypothetical protein
MEHYDRDGSREQFVLQLSSPGGDAFSLLRLYELTRGRIRTLVVTGDCFSACAEFVQLTTAPVRVSPKTIIGFHTNGVIASLILEKHKLPGSFECSHRRADKFREIMTARSVNADKTAIEVMRRLRYVSVRSAPKLQSEAGCSEAIFRSEYRLWLPTSEQLRKTFKVDLIGTLCTDNPECLHSRLRTIWGEYPEVVVGDEPLIKLPDERPLS